MVKKSNIDYKSNKTDCKTDFCKEVSYLMNYLKTDKSCLYSDRQLNCSFDMKTTKLVDSDQSTIIGKINQEINSLNKVKSNQTIFFLFDREKPNEDISVSFESNVLKLIEGERITLKPKISETATTIKWSPSEGLSCSNCPNPEVAIKENITYEIKVTDSAGCNTAINKIELQVEKKCGCKNVTKNEILLKNHPENKVIRNNKGTEPEWEIISKESGDYIFDLVAKSNCADSFQVLVINQDDEEFFQMTYLVDDIDYPNTKHSFLKNFPDYFVFRIDLSDKKKQMSAKEQVYFRIVIIPFVNGTECSAAKYQSPRFEFSPCGL
jgi:hypothetical protein